MKALVFQHLAVEHPGYFRDLWQRDGVDWTLVKLDEGDPIPQDLGAYDALYVFGGPMDVWQTDLHPWLVEENAAIRHWVLELGKPYLGLCLGHQLLAKALGGEVKLAQTSEVGVGQVDLSQSGKVDPLFSGLADPIDCFQWHSAHVDKMPDRAAVLAFSDVCPVQALCYGKHAYGLQFHIEITPQTVPEWGAVAAYAKALETELGKDALPRLEEEVAGRLPDFQQTCDRIHTNFLAIIRSCVQSANG